MNEHDKYSYGQVTVVVTERTSSYNELSLKVHFTSKKFKQILLQLALSEQIIVAANSQ